jgi:C1A family cysteine protease
MNFSLNVRQPTQDNRDYIYEDIRNINTSNNNTCDYRDQLLPVRNQGTQGTCYAQSAACVKEWQERKHSSDSSYFSPQFIYNHRNYWNNDKQDGDDINEDYGMQGRDVMKILTKYGVCKEDIYPYGTLERMNDIDTNIIELAKKNVIKKYAKINTIEGLKKALIENGPCLIALPVYNYSQQMWIKDHDDSIFLGGHAMCVVGYNMNSFIIRNSWGENWGDNGYTYYKFDDWGCHWECWTTIDDLTNNIEQEKEIIENIADDVIEDTINDIIDNEVVQDDASDEADEADEVVKDDVIIEHNNICLKLLKLLGII